MRRFSGSAVGVLLLVLVTAGCLAEMMAGSPAAAVPLSVPAQTPGQALTGFPFTDEALAYNVTGPAGVNLGQGRMRSQKVNGGAWSFGLTIDAGVPGYAVKDNYTALANADFCSTDFTKSYSHGSRHGAEKESIERALASVTRVTGNGGGKSEFSIPDCMKDALTLLYYARRELGQGRVPPAQQILFGGLYDSALQYTGAETIQVAGQSVISDKVVCSIRGPSSSLQFEMFFARDPARTPLIFRVPLAIGQVSLELAR